MKKYRIIEEHFGSNIWYVPQVKALGLFWCSIDRIGFLNIDRAKATIESHKKKTKVEGYY